MKETHRFSFLGQNLEIVYAVVILALNDKLFWEIFIEACFITVFLLYLYLRAIFNELFGWLSCTVCKKEIWLWVMLIFPQNLWSVTIYAQILWSKCMVSHYVTLGLGIFHKNTTFG